MLVTNAKSYTCTVQNVYKNFFFYQMLSGTQSTFLVLNIKMNKHHLTIFEIMFQND